MEKMGSSVTVESSFGSGTLFRISSEMLSKVAENSPKNQDSCRPISNERELPSLLLVNDSQLVLKFFKMKLEKQFVVDTAQSGFEAVQKTKQEQYEIVLLDISMPIMDGFKAAYLIKSLSTPIPLMFALTGDETNEGKVSKDPNFTGCLSEINPATIQTLQQAVAQRKD